MSSLNKKLLELSETLIKKLPEDFALANAKAVKDLIKNVSTFGLEVGEEAPRFTLPDATGGSVSLTELVAQGPVVLSFYRGSW